MPEMTFEVKWPDGHVQSCYSPSLVMHDYLSAGSEYSVAEFLDHSRSALNEASERVKARFGVYCTSAAAQLSELEAKAIEHSPESRIRVLSMSPGAVTGGTK